MKMDLHFRLIEQESKVNRVIQKLEMDLLNISIDQEIPSIDQMNYFLKFH